MGRNEWSYSVSSCSPDLTVLGFLWGCLKTEIPNWRYEDIEVLKNVIMKTLYQIDGKTLLNFSRTVQKRLENVLKNEVAFLNKRCEHIFFSGKFKKLNF